MIYLSIYLFYPILFYSILILFYSIHTIYSFYLSISLSLSVCLSTCLSAIFIFQSWQHQKRSNSAWLTRLSKLTASKTKLFCETSSFFEVDNIKNETSLRDFFIIWTGQHPKRSNSARLLQILNVTTSKTKQLCETAFKNGKLSAELTASYQCVLRFFQSTCRKYCAFHEKVMPSHTKCCTCHAKSSQQTWRSDAPKFNLSGNQRADLLTSLMNMSFVLRLPCEMHLWRSSSNVPSLPSLLDMPQNPHVFLTFDKVHNPLRLPRETRSERPKVLRTRYFFWSFDLEMCFAPQQRALFRNLNFQKWSGNGVFCTFWLRNVLRATTACNFSFLIWPAGSAPAALASLLFNPPEPHHWKKNSVSRLSYLFAHLHLLSSGSFSSLICSLLLFSSLCLFPSLLFIWPYCRKFDF